MSRNSRSKQEPKEQKYKDEEKEHRFLNVSEGNEQKLKELLTQAFDLTRTSKGKDIVLVVGATGGGKSATTCYLVGCEMKEDKSSYPKKIVVKDSKGHRHPEIGTGVKSRTLFPDVFKSDTGINFNDCPGFEENRGEAEAICASVSIQAAIRVAKSIQGIMIVVEYDSLHTGRGSSFRELVATLSHLLVQSKALKKSVIFVITKTPTPSDVEPSVVRSSLFEQIGLMKIQYSEQLQERDDSELAAKLEVLKLVQENNSVFINPLDNGADRNLIFNLLSELQPVSKSQFHYTFHDENHIKFKRFVYKIARNGYRVCTDILEAHNEIKRCKEEIKRTEGNCKSHESAIAELRRKLSLISKDPDQRMDLDKEESELKKLIKGVNEEIDRLKLEVKRLNDRLNSLVKKGKNLENNQYTSPGKLHENKKRIFRMSQLLKQNTKEVNENLSYLFNKKQFLKYYLSITRNRQKEVKKIEEIENEIKKLKELKKNCEFRISQLIYTGKQNTTKLQDNQAEFKKEFKSYQLLANLQEIIKLNSTILVNFTIKFSQINRLFPHLLTKKSLSISPTSRYSPGFIKLRSPTSKSSPSSVYSPSYN